MDAEEIGRLIGELENRVERLRALYEQYFMGIERIEPLTVRKDVDRRLYALRREQIRNTGLRFKLETTIQRYNTYQQYWQRIVREIEAGTYQRDLGRAAQRFGDNAVTGFAKRRQKMFEKALTKKAEREALRQPGAGASQAPPAGDDGPPSSNETIDVTFDDVEAAEPPSTRSPQRPIPSAEPHEPLELEISEPAPPLPRVGPAPSAGVARPEPRKAPPPAEPRRAPPPAPAVAAPAPAAGPPRPASPGAPPPYARPAAPAASPAAPRPPTAVPPAPPPRAPLPSSQGVPPAPPPANRNVAAAAVRPAPTAMAAKPAAPPVTSAKPAALAGPGAKPATPIATPAKPAPPVPPSAKPATPIATPAAAAQAGATALGRPPAPARPPSPVASGQPAPATAAPRAPPMAPSVAAKPVAPAVQKPPAAAVRPPAASRPDVPAPAVKSEENSLSPIRMRQIYGAFVEAKRRANESTASVTYEKIATNLENVAKELRAKHKARSVDFEVVLKNGKPVLKPVVKS